MQKRPDRSKSLSRRRGRPVQISQDTRAEIVLAATVRLLSDHALDDISMAAIAREAGMSKRTIYELFDNREFLLSQCISRISQSFFLPLRPDEISLPLAERLKRLMTINNVQGFDPNSVELLRTIIAKANSYPTLASNLYNNGFCGLVDLIAVELRAAQEQGEIALPCDAIEDAADMLCQMALENPMRKLLIVDSPPPTPDEMADRRDLALDLFMNGACRGCCSDE
ncbi:TetR/AcrR family transcriptional regulator [Albibacillus kandeliae]|uniref:TetR/AcrR family transcriptional regulator n=1 Tax=Albibacillus kandeliae TaxID=2174228 RepID=UPI000D69C875|nr:TetR/AcrR family transcriptional regulator [Albibacillus kandeliae]